MTAFRLQRLAWALLLAGAVPLAGWLGPWLRGSAPTLCLFRLLTGRPCVFCGLTRALSCFWQGQIRAAFGFHPLWPVALLLLAALAATCLLDAITGRSHFGPWRRAWINSRWYLPAAIVLGTLWRAMAGP